MDDELGSSPSYTWRDFGRLNGCLEGDSDGELGTEKILKCGPIHEFQELKLAKSYPQGVNVELEVGALIDPIRKDWNKDLRSQLFLPFEIDCIVSIPLSNRFPEDRLCWDLEKDDIYLVRSAYIQNFSRGCLTHDGGVCVECFRFMKENLGCCGYSQGHVICLACVFAGPRDASQVEPLNPISRSYLWDVQ